MLRPLFLTIVIFLTAFATPAFADRNSRAGCFISNLVSEARKTKLLYTGKLTTKMDPKSFEIFEKVRLDPEFALSESGKTWIATQGLTRALSEYRGTTGFVRDLNHWLALNKRLKPLNWKSTTWKQTAWRWFNNFFLSGFGGPYNRARKIFGKFIDDPNAQLTTGEETFIGNWKLENELARFREDLEMNRKGFARVSRINAWGRRARLGILVGAGAGGPALEQIEQRDLSAKQAFDMCAADGLKPVNEVNLILPTDSTSPPILVVGRAAFVFSPAQVGADLTDQSDALKKMEMNGTPHFRIRLNATSQQIEDLTDRITGYIDYSKGTPIYVDAPDGEIFRILRQELGLPALPVVNRSNKILLSYFKVLRAVEGRNGPIQQIYRVNVPKEPNVKKVAEDAYQTAWSADSLFSLPLIVGGLAAYDRKSSTLIHLGKPVPASTESSPPLPKLKSCPGH